MGSLFKPSQQKTNLDLHAVGASGRPAKERLWRCSVPLRQSEGYTLSTAANSTPGMDPLTTRASNPVPVTQPERAPTQRAYVLSCRDRISSARRTARPTVALQQPYGRRDHGPDGQHRLGGRLRGQPLSQRPDRRGEPRRCSRNLYENQIPGLNMSATGSGNMNSSRAGVAQGIMTRGAADQIGDIASQDAGRTPTLMASASPSKADSPT
jgi:hypothetical protein